MAYYTGIDVSLRSVSICIVNDKGEVCLETNVECLGRASRQDTWPPPRGHCRRPQASSDPASHVDRRFAVPLGSRRDPRIRAININSES